MYYTYYVLRNDGIMMHAYTTKLQAKRAILSEKIRTDV